MINYVVYSHTDYLDILRIQTDYISKYDKTTLLINANELILTDLYEKYSNVIFYNENDVYASRLLTSVSQIEDEYFLLIHDNDILLNADENVLKDMYHFLKNNNFDRVDLKCNPLFSSNISVNVNENFVLLLDENPSNYIFNVNPSIWKKDTLQTILSTFRDRTYRNIENIDVQHFCKNYKIFKVCSDNKLQCGYYTCLEYFKFLHISHNGKLLHYNKNFLTNYGQSYHDVSNDYLNMIDKYKLNYSNKWVD